MSRFLAHITVVSCSLLLSNCQPTSLPPAALTAYVNNPVHGLCQHQLAAGTEITVTYQPADLLVARELPTTGTGKTTLDSLHQRYERASYFLLSFSRDGQSILQPTEGFTHYSGLLQTLAFHMPEYAQVITSAGDTLRPVNYYLDRTTPNTEATQVLLAFTKLPSTGSWRFRLRECGLATGDLTFTFEAKQTIAVPALSLL